MPAQMRYRSLCQSHADTQVGITAASVAAPAARRPRSCRRGRWRGGDPELLTGANAGKELELTKTLTTLGKPGVQVAVITRRPHGYFITHVEGANNPIVSGVR